MIYVPHRSAIWLLAGMPATSRSITSWLMLAPPRMSVATKAGETALTRMFFGPSSFAISFISPGIPAFAAE